MAHSVFVFFEIFLQKSSNLKHTCYAKMGRCGNAKFGIQRAMDSAYNLKQFRFQFFLKLRFLVISTNIDQIFQGTKSLFFISGMQYCVLFLCGQKQKTTEVFCHCKKKPQSSSTLLEEQHFQSCIITQLCKTIISQQRAWP